MTIKKIFKSQMPSCNYVFRNGVVAHFINGKYATDQETEIAEITAEITARHPHLYVDANESEIDSEALSPMEIIKQKAVAEYIANMAAATNPANDRGTSEKEKPTAGMATSRSNAATALASDSQASANVASAMAAIKAAK